MARQVAQLEDAYLDAKDDHSNALIDGPRDTSPTASIELNAIESAPADFGVRQQSLSSSTSSKSSLKSSVFSAHVLSSTAGTSLEAAEENNRHWLYDLFEDLPVTSLEISQEQ